MPWRGPNQPGEFPTLGYQVGTWIQEHLVIGDGLRQGDPYVLTDEMWRFLVRFYRLFEDAREWSGRYVSESGDVIRALRYTGGQLRRSQKWGKDPFGAAICWAEALGPTRFAGWDAYGEPVGAPYPTPLIVELGTSEDQTENTWRPTRQEVLGGDGHRPSRLINDPRITNLDIAKIDLRHGGRIEPVTTSAKARLGAPMTFATITESHLFTIQGGYRKVCGAVKRNIAGMDGRWLELTNAWDPTEGSEAQVTAAAKDPDVLIDTVEPNRVIDLENNFELYAELRRQYGDSSRERGGWVNLDRIASECRSTRHLESDRRRFFLNEIVIGENRFVDAPAWDLKVVDEILAPKDSVALGFDGAKYRDGTALIASRMSDGTLFELGIWERPRNAPPEWRVPSPEVDARVKEVFTTYNVTALFADPWRWQDYLDAWSALYPGRVFEYPTNQEPRMDRGIERFTTAFGRGEIHWSRAMGQPPQDEGSADPIRLSTHVKNAVIVKGGHKKVRPGENEEEVDTIQTHYLRLAKKGLGALIDGAVAAVLAWEARAHAIEHSLVQEETEVWGFWS